MNQDLGICSVSLGWHPSHTLEDKITAAKNAEIKGLELCMADLDKFAKRQSLTRLEAAKKVTALCDEAGIKIFVFGPFEHFEGTPTPLQDRLEKAAEWMTIAHEMRCNILQVPSNFRKDAIGDEEVIVTELRALADLGQKQSPPISIAYEALAWGLHVADWEESLRIVDLVDRSNFGLCLDTYHVLARVWADPRSVSGIRPGAASTLRDTIQRFVDTCKAEKIVYVQLSDGEKLASPIVPGHVAYKEEDEATWSYCLYGRVFPLEVEAGAYFPLRDILYAWLVKSGWKGWASMETFHRDMNEESQGPAVWAERAVKSWDRIQKLLDDDVK